MRSKRLTMRLRAFFCVRIIMRACVGVSDEVLSNC